MGTGEDHVSKTNQFKRSVQPVPFAYCKHKLPRLLESAVRIGLILIFC